MRNQQESAQVLALQALGWLATDEAQFQQFLMSTGADVGDVRARAADPDFQLAILDFLMLEDQRIVAFCDAHGLPYTAPQLARAALPGGELPHWT